MTPTPPPMTLSIDGWDDEAEHDGEAEAASATGGELAATAGGRPAARPVAPRARTRWVAAAAVLALLTLSAARLGDGGIASGRRATAARVIELATSPPTDGVPRPRPRGEAAPPSAQPPRVRLSIDGGVLSLPAAGPMGRYDLLLHFHGHEAAVEQSVDCAGIDAALAVINLGVGATVYRERYDADGAYEALLDEIDRAIRAQLGAVGLRRVALSAFSAGYGAVASILARRRGTDPLDAVLVIDGIYSGWLDSQHTEIDPDPLAVFLPFAEAAADGEVLMSLSHSMIAPHDAVGPGRTARYLLVHAGGRVEPQAMLPEPGRVQLQSRELLVSSAHRLQPVHDSRIGELRVRGYQGTESEDHSAQLLQMAATVLPDLAERWDQD